MTQSMRERRWTTVRPGHAWGEAVAATAQLPLIGLAVDPRDPLLAHGFCWTILPPLLIALRHGFAPALASAAALSAGQLALAVLGFGQGPQLELLLGMLLTVGLIGYGMGQLRRKLAEVGTDLAWLSGRSAQLLREHALLEMSHARLEQRVCTGPVESLRTSLAAMRREMRSAAPATLEAMAQRIVELFAVYARVETASLYHVQGRRPLGAPLAAVGNPSPVAADDPLLLASLGSGKIALAPSGSELARATCLMLAVPLTDLTGRTHGILAVQSLPFSALEGENLKLIGILAGQIADGLDCGAADEHVELHHFELSLRRAVREVQEQGVAHTLILLGVGVEQTDDALLEHVLRAELRELDEALVMANTALEPGQREGAPALRKPRLRPRAGRRVLAVLLRHSALEGGEAFAARVERWYQAELGESGPLRGISLHVLGIDGRTEGEALVRGLFDKESLDEKMAAVARPA